MDRLDTRLEAASLTQEQQTKSAPARKARCSSAAAQPLTERLQITAGCPAGSSAQVYEELGTNVALLEAELK